MRNTILLITLSSLLAFTATNSTAAEKNKENKPACEGTRLTKGETCMSHYKKKHTCENAYIRSGTSYHQCGRSQAYFGACVIKSPCKRK